MTQAILQQVVCQAVVIKAKIATLVLKIQLADTANSAKSDISGLPLLDQIIQITHGTCISATATWATTIRATTTMSGVLGRVETAFLAQRQRALLPAGLREAGMVLAVETYPDTSQLCDSRFFPETFQETFQGTSLRGSARSV